MSRPRIGFLGVGWIGRHRMEAALATGAIEAIAVADPSADNLDAALALAPDARAVPDLDAMLALEPDGIVIASPSALHADQSVAALEAGAAVFCQKPLGRDAEEAARVVEAARARDLYLGVDFSYRRAAAFEAADALVRSGELGRIFAADLVFHNAYGPDKPWFYDRALSGGGCVMDLGCHLIDQALGTLGGTDARKVSASLHAGGEPLSPCGVEDYAVAQMTVNGAAVRLACSWRLQAGQEAVIEASYYGTAGGVSVRNVGGSFYDFEAVRMNGTASQVIANGADSWGGRMAADWAVRLANGQRFDPAAESFVAAARAVDAIYAAAR